MRGSEAWTRGGSWRKPLTVLASRRCLVLTWGAAACLLVGLLLGCGGEPTPTPTPIPTRTPVPTFTPSPTAVPPTAPPPARSLANALARTQAAQNFRVDLSVSGHGDFLSGILPVLSNASGENVVLVKMTGEVDGQNARLQLEGQFTRLYGLQPGTRLEVISHAGTAYLKGPLPSFKLNDDRWYQIPPGGLPLAESPLLVRSFLASFGQNALDPADFKLTRTGMLDNHTCEIWSGAKSVVTRALERLGADPAELETIDRAGFELRACDDGYLHQASMLIEGHTRNKPDEPGALEVAVMLADFDTIPEITPPPGAVTSNLPNLFPNPLPTP